VLCVAQLVVEVGEIFEELRVLPVEEVLEILVGRNNFGAKSEHVIRSHSGVSSHPLTSLMGFSRGASVFNVGRLLIC
jgi:hypothetical protein